MWRRFIGVYLVYLGRSKMNGSPDGVSTGSDPTKAVLSESGLNSKHLCDYVINVATGCRHGCKFCYVPSTPAVRTRPEMLKERADVDNAQREWGQYVLYRDDLPERLDDHLSRKRTWNRTEFGCGIVGISFATDCYMDGRAGEITRGVIQTLSKHERYARILTRNPILALQDLDAFVDSGKYVTIGSSIPCLDQELVACLEPRAPAPRHRLRGLKEFNDHGVQTYVSMSPTYPTMDKQNLRNQLSEIAKCDPEVIFHEPINPRGANFEMTVQAARDAGLDTLADELTALRDRKTWARYATKHLRWVQELGEELGLPVHLWPDKQLSKHVDARETDWIQAWRQRQSPEQFGERDAPSGSPPKTPRSPASAD